MKSIIYWLLLFLSVALIAIGFAAGHQFGPELLYLTLSSIGSSLFVALTVSRISEKLLFESIDAKLTYWGRRAGISSLSGIVGYEVPDHIADSLTDLLNAKGFKRSDCEVHYRFDFQGAAIGVRVVYGFTMHNITNLPQPYLYREQFQKGLFHDNGSSLKFISFKAFDPDTSATLLEDSAPKRGETESSIFYERDLMIPPLQKVRFVSISSFTSVEQFSYYETVNSPVHGMTLRIEHNCADAIIGITDATFWRNKLYAEFADVWGKTIKYGGVVFPGQSIAFWVRRKNHKP